MQVGTGPAGEEVQTLDVRRVRRLESSDLAIAPSKRQSGPSTSRTSLLSQAPREPRDFTDCRDKGSGIMSLTDGDEVQDVVRRLPQADEWTHNWSGGHEYRQLDYMLLSDALANANPGVRPIILRFGLPWRATVACCAKCYSGFHGRSPAKDPVAPPEGAVNRVTRGGGSRVSAVAARSAYRAYLTPSYTGLYLGVRPARVITK